MNMTEGDKRHLPRNKRRLLVRYGVEKTDRSAYTQNISEAGLFVRTNRVFKPATTVHLEIHFPGELFHLWGRVAWAKKVPPQLAHILACGMGIRYLDPPVEFLEFYQKWSSPKG